MATTWTRDPRPSRRPGVPGHAAIRRTFRYNPKFDGREIRSEAAKALLDKFGYVDRDKDGWRDLPDGKPLVLKIATERPPRPAVQRAVAAA
jgi:ABC-type transport system substrate-binding protein